MRSRLIALSVAALAAALALAGCHHAAPPATSSATNRATAAPAATAQLGPKPANPKLDYTADIVTTMGAIEVTLFPRRAPLAVGNFVGLATGTQAWRDPATGQIMHRSLYSGTIFHRVIPGFMIQGGDPLGTGMGTPGYQFANEVSPSLTYDRPGRLAMANAGPNTNGSQFFITTAPQPHLNGGYTIFGQVIHGQQVVDAISKVPRNMQNNMPFKAVVIEKITVHTAPRRS
ncbi:MAG: peptidylprolyl isomerase [Terriglobales bacterium]